jgi:hypothetical protein
MHEDKLRAAGCLAVLRDAVWVGVKVRHDILGAVFEQSMGEGGHDALGRGWLGSSANECIVSELQDIAWCCDTCMVAIRDGEFTGHYFPAVHSACGSRRWLEEVSGL